MTVLVLAAVLPMGADNCSATQENCQDVKAMVRGRHRMAYPVKGNWEGIYVLFSFLAQPITAPKVQILLSNPPAGAEDNILRHMTLNY